MTRNLPNTTNLLGTTQTQSPIYRPKYRTRVDNPSYALEQRVVSVPDKPDLFQAVNALEEWRTQSAGDNSSSQVRWHADKLKSLQVFVSPGPKRDWDTLILKACREWESASAGHVQFLQTVRPEQADILFEWADKPVMGREFEVGHTHREVRDPHWIQKARVTLLTEPAIDKVLPANRIGARFYTTVLHEVGHALGLEHSQHKKDIMHHQGWQNPRLTANDISRLVAIYQSAPSRVIWL